MVKTFKNRVRSESVLIRLGGVGAYGGIDPLSDFIISARGQTSHWARFFIYVVEQIARQDIFLSLYSSRWISACRCESDTALSSMSRTPYILFPQEVKLHRGRDILFIRDISNHQPRDFIHLMKGESYFSQGEKKV